ncbi:MAG TPA: DUF1844 domain-containing protein [Acidimicrobiia bacterium]|nr:DUF1844 domain-containing protein [Acidimicrobiia bacterium]
MSGLWTPGSGEPSEPAGGPDDVPDLGTSEPAPTPEELEAVRELHQRLAATPVADVIVNHAIGIWQLALVHLGVVTPPDDQGRRPPPDLASAGLAIDALAALVDGLADRLGEGEEMLRDALRQVQMLFVEIADATDG